jgi:hypothetical protein
MALKERARGKNAKEKDNGNAHTGTALDTITRSDAQGWFESCGYTAFQN